MFDNEQVISILCQQLQIDPDSVDMNTDIMDDLGADSLDAAEMLMVLEDSFGIEIADEEIHDIRTVGDLCRYIERAIG